MQVTKLILLTIALGDSTYAEMCSAELCCGSIAAAGLQDGLLYSGTEAYEARLSSVYSPNARLESWCIYQPTTAKETAIALRALADTNCCSIGVRSGGHGIWTGANYIADGVTIDFGNLNSTSYNEDTGIASIEPGTNWGTVYQSLQEFGVTVAGGRTPGVGVGGFLTGGGISFYSGKYGFGCDTVVNFEVVLADGSIVNANASSSPDLWQALKGGHGNLGLVTRFDMQAITSTKIWGGPHIYHNNASIAVVEAVTKFIDGSADDPASSAMTIWTYMPQTKQTVILSAIINTDGVDDASVLQDFRNAQPLLFATPRHDTHAGIVKDFDFAIGYHGVWFTLTWGNSPEMNLYMVSLNDPLIAELKGALGQDADFMTQWALSPILPIIAQRGKERGGNVLGLERWDTPGVFLCAALSVRGTDANDIGRPILKKYVNMLEAKARELGVFRDWLYINYADGTQDPFSGIGEDALVRLKNAARKYDPNGIFQRKVVSGYKLPLPNREDATTGHTVKDEL